MSPNFAFCFCVGVVLIDEGWTWRSCWRLGGAWGSGKGGNLDLSSSQALTQSAAEALLAELKAAVGFSPSVRAFFADLLQMFVILEYAALGRIGNSKQSPKSCSDARRGGKGWFSWVILCMAFEILWERLFEVFNSNSRIRVCAIVSEFGSADPYTLLRGGGGGRRLQRFERSGGSVAALVIACQSYLSGKGHSTPWLSTPSGQRHRWHWKYAWPALIRAVSLFIASLKVPPRIVDSDSECDRNLIQWSCLWMFGQRHRPQKRKG